MKAISLWNPHGTLVALGAKKWETRSKAISYRGPIAIHTTQYFGTKERALCELSPFRACLSVGGFERADDLPRGMFVAIAELVEIVRTEEIVERLSAQERAFGDYRPGRFAWRLEQVRSIYPWTGRGRQFLWNLDAAMAMFLRARVKDLC